MSLAAYKRTAQFTETPRDIEARLLGDVCAELRTVQNFRSGDPDPSNERRLREALDWNRRVWMTLTFECASPTNPLEPALRAKIVSLGIWVSRYTEDAMWNNAVITPLIDVNEALIKGLMGRAAQAA
jgi:flagellar protein FlaF